MTKVRSSLVAISIAASFIFTTNAQVKTSNSTPSAILDQNKSGARQINGGETTPTGLPANSPSISGDVSAATVVGPPMRAARQIYPDNPPLSIPNQVASVPGIGGLGTQQDIPAYATYRFFFVNMALLEHAADRDQKAGKAQTAALWRTHEQRAAGLTEPEGDVLKQLVQQCNQAVKDQDLKIQEAVRNFRALRGADLSIPIPLELLQMGDDRAAIITTFIDKLKVALGDASFQKLDAYVQSSFKPQILHPSPSAPPSLIKVQKEGK